MNDSSGTFADIQQTSRRGILAFFFSFATSFVLDFSVSLLHASVVLRNGFEHVVEKAETLVLWVNSRVFH